MKRSLIILSVLLVAGFVSAQSTFTLNTVPMCWSIGGSDSSIVANWAVGINDDTPLVLGYVDAYGNAVNVVGGTLVIGYCNSGGGTVSNVSITDNFDGTYTAIVNADTTLIRADVCGDTITQVAHGFSVGDLLGQTAGNGAYFLANTASPDNFPVTAVIDSIDANTFVGCNEKVFVTFQHGLPLGRDYFLQDDGSVDTIPDSTYNVFAFRTLKINKAYFDIPELVVSLEGGGAGGGTATADADWYDSTTDAPPTTMGQNIYTTGSAAIGENLTIGLNGSFRTERLFVELSAAAGSQEARFGSGDATDLRIYRDGAGMWLVNSAGPTGSHESILFSSTSDNMFFYTAGNLRFRITNLGYLLYDDAPTYANDAAADADSNLPSGGIYTLTGDRTLYIKP